jgi:glucose/mannose transport system substrate-binding protein
MLTKNGQTYAVLVGIHRGNDLWYNKKVLEKNGIKVGDKMTFAEFFAAAEKHNTVRSSLGRCLVLLTSLNA